MFGVQLAQGGLEQPLGAVQRLEKSFKVLHFPWRVVNLLNGQLGLALESFGVDRFFRFSRMLQHLEAVRKIRIADAFQLQENEERCVRAVDGGRAALMKYDPMFGDVFEL